MNSAQAKRLPLSGILKQLGYEPHHEIRGELWYNSPLRREAEPSFKINQERNIWYDFGAGKGGNVLDFVMEYHKLSSIAEALHQLSDMTGKAKIEPVSLPPVTDSATGSQITIRKIQPLEHTALIRYLKERGISPQTAKPYVQEIHYTRKGKDYFALAFPTDSGGYELRNRYYKGTHGNKSISLVKKGKMERHDAITVFEGFMDFLSALEHYRKPIATPVIVLNGVPMKHEAVEAIGKLEVSKVYLYLDNDRSGRDLTAYFKESLPNHAIVDKSGLYAGYDDFNAWLVNARKRQRA